MKIGLLSDTHDYLPESVFEHFKDCDEIWHAGDIGSMKLVYKLESFKPFKAVYGNIDDSSVRRAFPENLRFNCEGLDILITHIAGTPPRYNRRVKSMLQESAPQILICGHHIF